MFLMLRVYYLLFKMNDKLIINQQILKYRVNYNYLLLIVG
jgi:hypothetical protein